MSLPWKYATFLLTILILQIQPLQSVPANDGNCKESYLLELWKNIGFHGAQKDIATKELGNIIVVGWIACVDICKNDGKCVEKILNALKDEEGEKRQKLIDNLNGIVTAQENIKGLAGIKKLMEK